MGLFKLRQELAVDLGTANTIIMKDGKIVFDEPSVIAFDRRNDEVIAVGTKASTFAPCSAQRWRHSGF